MIEDAYKGYKTLTPLTYQQINSNSKVRSTYLKIVSGFTTSKLVSINNITMDTQKNQNICDSVSAPQKQSATSWHAMQCTHGPNYYSIYIYLNV